MGITGDDRFAVSAEKAPHPEILALLPNWEQGAKAEFTSASFTASIYTLHWLPQASTTDWHAEVFVIICKFDNLKQEIPPYICSNFYVYT